MKLKRTITLHVKNSIDPECFRGFFLVPLALVCFGLSPAPKAFGVSPAPDGGYPNFNTAEGYNALASLSSGFDNTANGVNALYHNTTGKDNTAIGYAALNSNTTAMDNTANGVNALLSNTTGNFNTANGASALYHNTTANDAAPKIPREYSGRPRVESCPHRSLASIAFGSDLLDSCAPALSPRPSGYAIYVAASQLTHSILIRPTPRNAINITIVKPH